MRRRAAGCRRRPVLAACIGVVVLTAVLAVMFLSASGNVAKQQRALQDAQATYNALPAPAAPSSAETELPALRTTRVTALASALGQRVAWDRLLREVSQVVPSDVWLLNLNAQSPAVGAAAAAAPRRAPSRRPSPSPAAPTPRIRSLGSSRASTSFPTSPT